MDNKYAVALTAKSRSGKIFIKPIIFSLMILGFSFFPSVSKSQPSSEDITSQKSYLSAQVNCSAIKAEIAQLERSVAMLESRAKQEDDPMRAQVHLSKAIGQQNRVVYLTDLFFANCNSQQW